MRGLVREFSRRDGLTDVASLAPLVLVAADEGDEVAIAIVELIGGRMGRWTRYAARQVGVLGAFRLLLGGGLLRQPGSERFLRAALAELPDADTVRLEAEPVLGALLLGFDAAAPGGRRGRPAGAASERAHLLTAAGSSAVAVAPRRRSSTRAATGSTSGAQP